MFNLPENYRFYLPNVINSKHRVSFMSVSIQYLRITNSMELLLRISSQSNLTSFSYLKQNNICSLVLPTGVSCWQAKKRNGSNIHAENRYQKSDVRETWQKDDCSMLRILRRKLLDESSRYALSISNHRDILRFYKSFSEFYVMSSEIGTYRNITRLYCRVYIQVFGIIRLITHNTISNKNVHRKRYFK